MSLVPREPFYFSIPRRLAEIPDNWSPYDPRVLREIDDRTDALLTRCGLREVGLPCVVRHERSDVEIHAYLLATGNWTHDDINRAVEPGCPTEWSDGKADVVLNLPDKHRRTMRGAEFLLMLHDQSLAQVIISEILSGRHVASPDIRLEEWRRHGARNGAGETFAAAQADARTGDVTQSVHQPINVNNHIDLAPITDLIKTALKPQSAEPPEDAQRKTRATDVSEEAFAPILRRCYLQAHEAYGAALEALKESGIEPTSKAIWAYVSDTPITLRDGTQYKPPPSRKTFDDYCNRALNAARPGDL